MRLPLMLLGCLLGFVAVPPRAHAHGLGADWKVHGNRIEVEAYYDGGASARNARVRVRDAEKRLVAEGRTDAEGRWSFVIPPDGHYVVLVDAGAGHATQMHLTLPAPTDDDDVTGSEASEPSAGSGGSARAAFTAFHWLQLGIGVAILGGIGGAFWLARRSTVTRTE